MVVRVRAQAAIAALYLPGSPYGIVSPSGWPRVARAIEGRDDPSSALQDAGLVDEANALNEAALNWGLEQVSGEHVLTVLDDAYPAGWRNRLGGAAPAAVWRAGTIPGGPWVTVVGSRGLSDAQIALVRSVGSAVVSAGMGVVSGGARGTDRAAVDGARSCGSGVRVLEILPEGIESARPGVPSLSPNPIESGFRGTQAMYRNRLLYAWSGRAVIVAVRDGQGGTWHGAVAAIRDGLAHLFVRQDGSEGALALISRGARPWTKVDELMVALSDPLPEDQPELFQSRSDSGHLGTGRLPTRSIPFPSPSAE